MTEVGQIFKQHGVVPDVLTTAPAQFLTVTYANDCKVDGGNELTPTQVKNPPTIEWHDEDNSLYLLILTDPDAPSRKNPQFREYQHWIVGNIPGNNIAKGDIIKVYIGAAPPEGTGLHRYVFLLYKQQGKIKFNEDRIPANSGNNRGRFSTSKFVKKYKMDNPMAGNFFQAQWDDYVPTVHRKLSGRK